MDLAEARYFSGGDMAAFLRLLLPMRREENEGENQRFRGTIARQRFCVLLRLIGGYVMDYFVTDWIYCCGDTETNKGES